jgi:hypothetical protein
VQQGFCRIDAIAGQDVRLDLGAGSREGRNLSAHLLVFAPLIAVGAVNEQDAKALEAVARRELH